MIRYIKDSANEATTVALWEAKKGSPIPPNWVELRSFAFHVMIINIGTKREQFNRTFVYTK